MLPLIFRHRSFCPFQSRFFHGKRMRTSPEFLDFTGVFRLLSLLYSMGTRSTPVLRTKHKPEKPAVYHRACGHQHHFEPLCAYIAECGKGRSGETDRIASTSRITTPYTTFHGEVMKGRAKKYEVSSDKSSENLSKAMFYEY